MPYVDWNHDIEVGIEEIDEQHHNLVKLFNAVEGLRKEGKLAKNANKIIYTLLSFAKFHFRTEETLMLENGYPEYEKQKKEHDKLIEKVSNLKEKVENGKNVDYFSIYNFLIEWFPHHTRVHDLRYVPFFVENGIAKRAGKADGTKSQRKEKLTLGQISLIEWIPEYDFGILDIDNQHRSLVDAINMLYVTINRPNKKEIVESAFKELKKYTSQHFNREEGLMEKHKYPDLIVHRMQHDDFKIQLAKIKQKYDKFKTVIDHDLVIMLRDWFMNHTQNEDRKYLVCIAKG